MIVLFTDFGFEGPYVGEMKSVLALQAPGVPVIDLMHDAPQFDPRASAYLLAPLVERFPKDTVFLCVVDPGVGSIRAPIAVCADGRHFVGPDNGLFDIVRRRARDVRAWTLTWRPKTLSASFHGRDLFAPAAAAIATGRDLPREERAPDSDIYREWPDDLAEIIYIDRYGNAMSGLRAATLPDGAALAGGGRIFSRARTFSDVAKGAAFWYENSCGLAEIAVNQGRASDLPGISVGASLEVREPS